jgi:hypothetical protein
MADSDGDELDRRAVLDVGDDLAQMLLKVVAGIDREGGMRCEQCETVHAHEAAPSVASDRPLILGEPVLAQWAGRWWRAELLEQLGDDRWRVRYVGWSDEHAQELGRDLIYDLGGGAPVRRWKLVLAAVGLALLCAVGILLANKGKLVESHGAAVEADTVLNVGTPIEIERDGVWVAGEVLGSNDNGTVLVRYLDRGPKGDENVPRSKLRLP